MVSKEIPYTDWPREIKQNTNKQRKWKWKRLTGCLWSTGASLPLLLARLSGMILRIFVFFEESDWQLQLTFSPWASHHTNYIGSFKKRNPCVLWETIAWTVTPVSGMNCNHLCSFPASNLEMIMSSTLWHAIGFCYLTTVPWPLRLSKVSCSKLENCRNTFPCGTVTKYYSAC